MDFTSQWLILPILVATDAIVALGLAGTLLYMLKSWLLPARPRAARV